MFSHEQMMKLDKSSKAGVKTFPVPRVVVIKFSPATFKCKKKVKVDLRMIAYIMQCTACE